MIYLKIAWRNIFRNKRRTVITGIAIGLGLASLIFTDALVKGMTKNMIETVTSSFIGSGQIHSEDYKKSKTVTDTIVNYTGLKEKLRASEEIRAWAPRLMAMGMISSSANYTQMLLWGIDINREKVVSEIDENIVKGEYLDSIGEKSVLIGKDLAEDLEVGLGDRVVVSVAEAGTGDISRAMLRVKGIFNTGTDEMDKVMVFVDRKNAEEIMGVRSTAHEIVLDLKDQKIALDSTHHLWEYLSEGGNIAEGWPGIMESLKGVLDMSDFSTGIIMVILFGIVSLIIVNTLFMSLYERIFEFGVMRAVGTRASALWRIIIYEAGSLAVVSCIIGTVIALLVTWIYSIYGIDYRGIEVSGVTIQEKIYPVMTISQYIIYPVIAVVFTALAGIYPAVHAAMISPAKALRRTL